MNRVIFFLLLASSVYARDINSANRNKQDDKLSPHDYAVPNDNLDSCALLCAEADFEQPITID